MSLFLVDHAVLDEFSGDDENDVGAELDENNIVAERMTLMLNLIKMILLAVGQTRDFGQTN